VNEADDESARAWLAGFVVRRASPVASSWRSTGDLAGYLAERDVPGLTGLDTRALVRHLRDGGAQHGAIVSDGGTAGDALVLAATAPDINAMDLVGEVTCPAPYAWDEPADADWYPARGAEADPLRLLHVVVCDFGVKRNTLRLLTSRGCRVTVVPARTSAAEVLALAPDGVLLSNGPGDPATLGDIVAEIRALLGRVPVFGICLGHQLLGLALGGRTYKLKFGHRGANQPVQHCPSHGVAISSHNHGFALAPDLGEGVVITHVNLNDGCVEGLAAPALRAFSVQYHPEAAPGPHDASDLFDAFVRAMGG
jgi:carbamoyl-phosphate synthase small subunit